ncbi:DUF2972 domain-containing protein [Campylobacter novaezeelandiae]|nr:DUF2972 domain-containing protein [Campylobacter novaezeelandiae]TBR81180.1 DUF2972 domain-containing protein [Campylobacter novaezeelandiae]
MQILQTLKEKLDPKNANLILNALKNSNDENFFEFILNHIDIIANWLSSNEFKEKYSNHPYPPLINPELIDIDASEYCANLSWNLNIPLSKKYKFIYISPHGVGAGAFLRYVNEALNTLCFPSWMLENDAKNRYCFLHTYLNNPNFINQGINLSELNVKDLEKFLYLLDDSIPCIIGVRDPIGILKHCLGRNWNKVQRNYEPMFNLTYDWHSYIDFLTHEKTEIKWDFKDLENNVFIIQKLIKILNPKNITYIDMSEFSEEKAFDTLTKLAQNLSLTPPHISKKNIFKSKEFRGYLRYLFPLKLYVNENDLKNIYSLHSTNNLKNYNINTKESILIIFNRFMDGEFLNIIEDIIQNDLCNDLGIFIHKNDFLKLHQNKQLYQGVKNYLKEFLDAIKDVIDQTEKDMLKETELLEHIKNNQEIIIYLKNKFDCEFEHINKYRPDIVDSWKYYKEFQSYC